MMDFPKFQELVTNRTGFAQMPDPTATGEYFSDSCGDMYTFYLKVGQGERIDDISYFTTGCGFGVATCAILTELAKGKTVDEASRITPAEIEAYLGGYPERKKDYPERVLETLRITIENYRKGTQTTTAAEAFSKIS
jgi:NifU-like protein involved in Fe-S cluster formation